jgi:uncharacterized membrane protein
MSGNARPGRPAHPPFTDFPLAAYVFTAGFDVISAIGGRQHRWSAQLWHAGTFVLLAGLAICLITMGTGFLDLVRFPVRSAAVTRTVVTHVCLMAAVFMIGAGDIAWRLSDYGSVAAAPAGVLALSVAAAVTACTGAFFGGKLVFRHGVGVAADALAESGPAEPRPAEARPAESRPTATGRCAGRADPATAVRPPPSQPDSLA